MDEILIVDDNTSFRSMLKRILRSKFPSIRIREAQDGNAAIKKTTEQPPDIIFMDVRMPGENGFKLTRRIKRVYPEIVVIMITSYDSPEYQQAAFESGADFFVSKKEATAEDILQRVESIMASY